MARDLTGALYETITAFPDRPAVSDTERSLTYSALDREVEVVARAFAAAGIDPGSVVAVRMPPSIDLIVVVLAVLRRGASYLPLDPSGPAQRGELILADARPAAVVEAASGVGEGAVTPVTSSIVLRQPSSWRPAPPGPAVADAGDRKAYIIYTSGTTGRPKGVPVTHRNVLSLFAATAGLFEFGEEDRWLLYHSVAFDFSVWEIWWALLHGGELVIPDRWVVRDPADSARLIRDRGVTVLNQTPTAFGVLAPELMAFHDQLSLRYVVFGGERLRPASLKGWVEEFGYDRPALVNMYGITEVTVHATHRRVTPGDVASTASPIGDPLPGFTARIVADDGSDADRGELLLAGPQVVNGYLDRPELSALRFGNFGDPDRIYYRSGDIVERLADGGLAYLGRSDDQVKVRGHRIELGEVEAALGGIPEITGVCVLPVELDGLTTLGCVYTTANGQALPAARLRTEFRARLPEYMVPRRTHWTDTLPLNQNGKVDRAALRKIIDGGDV